MILPEITLVRTSDMINRVISTVNVQSCLKLFFSFSFTRFIFVFTRCLAGISLITKLGLEKIYSSSTAGENPSLCC